MEFFEPKEVAVKFVVKAGSTNGTLICDIESANDGLIGAKVYRSVHGKNNVVYPQVYTVVSHNRESGKIRIAPYLREVPAVGDVFYISSIVMVPSGTIERVIL